MLNKLPHPQKSPNPQFDAIIDTTTARLPYLIWQYGNAIPIRNWTYPAPLLVPIPSQNCSLCDSVTSPDLVSTAVTDWTMECMFKVDRLEGDILVCCKATPVISQVLEEVFVHS